MDSKGRKQGSLKSGKKFSLFIFGVAILFTISFSILKLHNVRDSNANGNRVEEDYKNFIYKIRYDFGSESYIYLLENQVVKTVEIQPIYEECKELNCYNFTGKYDYKEQTINFSKEALEKVIQVFDELYQKSGEKEFNADAMELTKYQQSVLLAVIINDENQIAIENNMTIK